MVIWKSLLIVLLILLQGCSNSNDIAIVSTTIQEPIIVEEREFFFGANSVFTDPVLEEIIYGSEADREFFGRYKISFLRYPGGSPTRYYIYNSSDMSNQALSSYSDYLDERGSEKDIGPKKIDIDGDYSRFLRFCKDNGITPIIQINTLFYADGEELLKIGQFQDVKNAKLRQDRWEKIQIFINEQLDIAHKYHDIIYWEIGNEDYFMYEAAEYSNIVENLLIIIKSRYPDDKVIVEMAAPYFREGSQRKEKWNKEMIALLDAKGLLEDIDFFAPHFYEMPSEEIWPDKAISKIKANNAIGFQENIVSNFPQGYTPKLFYTEYASILTAQDNQYFGTQLHAMLMLHHLMSIRSGSNVFGIINHGFTQDNNALFVHERLIGMKGYREIDGNNSDSILFVHVTPQAKAASLFLNSIEGISTYEVNEGYSVSRSNYGNKNIRLHILSYSDDIDIDIGKYYGSEKVKVELYNFDDYRSKEFIAIPKILVATGNITLDGPGFLIVEKYQNN